MKKFNKLFTIGTKVMINNDWFTVVEIHESRLWIKVDGLAGSFQRNHIQKFKKKTNVNNPIVLKSYALQFANTLIDTTLIETGILTNKSKLENKDFILSYLGGGGHDSAIARMPKEFRAKYDSLIKAYDEDSDEQAENEINDFENLVQDLFAQQYDEMIDRLK